MNPPGWRPLAAFGQTPPAPSPAEAIVTLDLPSIGKLLVAGIFTGAAFAIGSGLVSRYVFKKH